MKYLILLEIYYDGSLEEAKEWIEEQLTPPYGCSEEEQEEYPSFEIK